MSTPSTPNLSTSSDGSPGASDSTLPLDPTTEVPVTLKTLRYCHGSPGPVGLWTRDTEGPLLDPEGVRDEVSPEPGGGYDPESDG